MAQITSPVSSSSVESYLGDKAEQLLGFSKPKISRDRLHLPGPDMVDRIFRHRPSHTHGRSDHMIDEADLRVHALNMTQGGFAHRADFKLHAVDVGERHTAQLLFPVGTIAAELNRAVGAVVVLPDEAGHGALHGVAHVVHDERIPVGPAVEIRYRIGVTREKGLVE